MSRHLSTYRPAALPTREEVAAERRAIDRGYAIYWNAKSVFAQLYDEGNEQLLELLRPIVDGLDGHINQYEIARLIKQRGEDDGNRVLMEATAREIARKVNIVRTNTSKKLSLSYRRAQARLSYQPLDPQVGG